MFGTLYTSWTFEYNHAVFVLDIILGQGAFGKVMRAEAFGLRDSESSTKVAVKMVKGQSVNKDFSSLEIFFKQCLTLYIFSFIFI